MNKLIALFALTTIISSPSFAASKKSEPKKVIPVSSSKSIEPDSEPGSYVFDSSGNRPNFSADFEFGTIGTFVFGFGVRVDVPTDINGNHFAFGAQTGMLFGSDSGVSIWAIPVLVTGKFFLPTYGNLKPYMGAGMGLSLTHYSAGRFASGTHTDFAFLLKPGMSFGQGDRLFVELPFGTMSNNFTILPSFGYHF